MKRRRLVFLLFLTWLGFSWVWLTPRVVLALPEKGMPIGRERLLDKIKGGWAGQVMGCTFGGPTEHRFPSTIIPDYMPLPWSPGQLIWSWENFPALYDDLYVDLTLLATLEQKGLPAAPEDLAKALARGQFLLHHGLQMARHNFLAGLKPPKTGHWLNNPHADDNDFSQAADLLGLLSPGMLASVIKLSDRIGRIISSGDGWYGGVYIAALYSLSFILDKTEAVVEEAVKLFPEKASFSRVIKDVLDNYRRQPADWKETWFQIQKKWGEDIGCPEGVFNPLNFEAKINAAWVTLGLLYGHGDFDRTLAITTRCGDDSDSNAAAAGGILGTILGYSQIPDKWKQDWNKVEKFKPKGIEITIEEAYQLSLKLALEMVKRNGGRVEGEEILLPSTKPPALAYEANFVNHFPRERRELNLRLSEMASETTVEFEGTGFAINAHLVKKVPEDHTYRVAIVVDGRLVGAAILPAHPFLRNPTPFFRYNLRPGKHKLFLQIAEPSPKADIQLDDMVIYDNKPVKK